MKTDTYKIKVSQLLALFLVTLFTGCENSFEPIKENNLYNYSMYGILDLSADTQWVRVMPLRTTIFRDSMPNNATVTMTRESDGLTEQLQDTLIRLAQNSYVWNFWTTQQLLPNETYTIKAESPEGEVTTGQAHIPSDFPLPELFFRENTGNCHIIIDSIVERIVVAENSYEFQIQRDLISGINTFSISHVGDVKPTFTGNHEIVFDDVPAIAAENNVSPQQIVNVDGKGLIVSADTNWVGLDIQNVELPGEASNVVNGLGVVTGIVSKRFELRPTREDQLNYTMCPPREQ